MSDTCWTLSHHFSPSGSKIILGGASVISPQWAGRDLGEAGGGEEERYEESSHGVDGSGEWQGLDCNKEQTPVKILPCSPSSRLQLHCWDDWSAGEKSDLYQSDVS